MNKAHFNLHNALTAWQSGPFATAVAVALVAVGYFYLQGDWRLAARGRRWPARRTAAFLAGLAAVDLALQSPVATFAGSYFEAHVLQHLLLMAVAPPLLALGAPATLLLQSGGRATKTRWLNVVRSAWFGALTFPVVVWFLYFGVMFAFFLTPAVNYAMEHMAVMDAVNIAFLAGGAFYWWPIVGVDPVLHWRMGYGARIANLAIGVPFEAFLGVAIMSDQRPVASMYSLSSTHSGGALLWAATELSTFAGLVPVFWQWVRAEERAGARANARAGAEGPARAMRPVRAREVATAPFATTNLEAAPATSGPSAAPARAAVAPPVFAQSFRPLLQPGNSSWEAMWKAKAGFVPGSARPVTEGRPRRPEDGAVRPPGDERPGDGPVRLPGAGRPPKAERPTPPPESQ